MIYYTVGAFALLIVVILLMIVLTDQGIAQWRYRRRVRRAEKSLDTNCDHVRRVCTKVCQKLDRFVKSHAPGSDGLTGLSDDSKGLEAYAHAQTLLAVLDRQLGSTMAAEERMERIRRRFGDTVARFKWILKYNTLCKVISTPAVRLYMDACRPMGNKLGTESRMRAESCLEFACAALPGMAKEDLRIRLKWLQTTKKLFHDKAWPLVAEGVVFYRLGALPRAETSLQTCVERFPRHWEARHWLAKTHLAAGHQELAREQWNNLAIDAADQPDVLLDAADGLFATDRRDEASELLESVSATNPELMLRARLIRAKALLRQDREGEAMEMLQEAASRPDVAMLLAELNSRQGNFDEATKLLVGAIDTNTIDPQQQWALASAFWNQQKYDEAASWFDRCEQSVFRKEEATLLRMRSLLCCDRYDEALQLLQSLREPPNSAAVAFYHGVGLYRSDKPAQALPHFKRAYRLASESQQSKLLQRSLLNRVACYHRIANDAVRTQQYEQSVKAFDELRKSFKPGHQHYQRILDNLAESNLRAGVHSFESVGEDGAAAAAGFIEKTIEILSDGESRTNGSRQQRLQKLFRLQGLLAGLYAVQQRYDDAVSLYDQMWKVTSSSEAVRFTRGLCKSRTADSQDGIAELMEISQGGKFALRAALALSSIRAEKNDFKTAAEMLLKSLRAEKNKKDTYYGEACCRVVTYSLSAGQTRQAKDLGVELLGKGNSALADVIVGALLAHEGECQEALPFLETGVATDGKPTPGTRLLNGVYRRVAASHCGRRSFSDAGDLLGRAMQRDVDPQLKQLFLLIKVATSADKQQQEINRETLKVLFGIFKASPDPDAMLLRAVAVGYQRCGRDLVRKGMFEDAKPLLTLAHDMWIQHTRGSRAFWSEYVERFNRGKQYQLTSNIDEIEIRIMRQLAAFCVTVAEEMLVAKIAGNSNESRFDDALFFWNESKRLTGKQTAQELFGEIVDVNQIVAKLGHKKCPSKVRALYLWLYEHVEAKEEYSKHASELALVEAIERLQEGQVTEFRALLTEAGKANKDCLKLAGQVRKLSGDVIRKIVNEFREKPIGMVLRMTNPSKYGQVLLHLVIVYAGFHDQLPGGLQTTQVVDTLDRMAQEILKKLA